MDNSEGLASSPPLKKARTAPPASGPSNIVGSNSSSSIPDMKEDSGEEEAEFLSFGEDDERKEEAEGSARKASIEGKDAQIKALQAKNRELIHENFFANNPALFESSPGHSPPSPPQLSRTGGPPHASEGPASSRSWSSWRSAARRRRIC